MFGEPTEVTIINVKPPRVPTPPGVVTLTLPVAPAPTTAEILVAELTLNVVAATPPKLTTLAPVKFVPVIVIVAPVPALIGVKDVIVGGEKNVNPASVAVPPGVVTLTLPVAPAPTTAEILVDEFTVKEVAATPPKLTTVAPVKLVPVIVIVVPVPALVGVKDVMVGAGINVKPARVAVPPGVVTLTFPVAPEPITAVIFVDEFTVNEVAATPPKLTAVVPVKLVPIIVIVVPEPPVIGEKDVIVGGAIAAIATIVFCVFVLTGRLKSK